MNTTVRVENRNSLCSESLLRRGAFRRCSLPGLGIECNVEDRRERGLAVEGEVRGSLTSYKLDT